MNKRRRTYKYPDTPTAPVELRDAAVADPPALVINVRSAKDQLSSLLDAAAQGREVVITSDGQPKARLAPLRVRRRPFLVDWAALEAQPVSPGPPAEEILRQDRDGRP